MRNSIYKSSLHDPRIQYRGQNASRLDNLTDAVFGIAITLLIFNLTNPNSFEDLLTFTKTLPAFLISITFLILVWREHVRFSEIYSMDDNRLLVLNTIFIAFVIFYVYPLRFLTLFLTNFFFQTDIHVYISGNHVPYLMIYYGFVAFALYFVLYLFYQRALRIRETLDLSSYEIFYTRSQRTRQMIMFVVPLISISLTALISQFSFIWASVIGGVSYSLYTPAMMLWIRRFKKADMQFEN